MDNSAMSTLKGLLGDDADKKIASVMSALSSSGSSESSSDNTGNNSSSANSTGAPQINSDALNSMMQIKSMVENLTNGNNDSRSNLLLSLKPFMRDTRKSSIDSAVRLLNITKLSGLFKMR